MQSLEKEIMRLQEVLKDREAEITILETSLKEIQGNRPVIPTPMSPVLEDGDPNVNDKVDIPHVRLTPQMTSRFDHIHKTMENGRIDSETGSEVTSPDAVEPLERLNELML